MQNFYFAARSIGFWGLFWKTDIIKGSTINYIETPYLGPLSLSTLAFLIFIAVFIVLILVKRNFSGASLKKYGIVSFLIACAFFALRMDINWLAVLGRDFKVFTNTDMNARIAATSGVDIKYFIDFVKKTIPEGEEIREIKIDQYDPAYTMTRLGNYYMLPVMASSRGRFIWVYYFTDASFDPEAGILRVYGSFFRARPYATYKEGAYIFEVLDG
ncbi:MAG: hypothetical protein HY954_02190 [Deltaproteobacteria bacterium]|nr:hypothetical protein [Deltaproteobacteria bacterium]